MKPVSKRIITAVVFLTVAVSANVFATGSETEINAEEPSGRLITVSADGSVQVVPDRIEFSFGVRSVAPTAKEAQEANSLTVDAVIEALKREGVEEKDIRTTNVYLYPQYDYSQDNAITGYEQTTELTVSGQTIEAAGKLIADGIAAGANEVQRVRYTFSNYEEAYDQALTLAVQNARRKGLVLAAAEGGELGAAVRITEGYQDVSARYKQMDNYALEEMATADMDTGSGAGISLMPGETEIQAQVTVTYAFDEP